MTVFSRAYVYTFSEADEKEAADALKKALDTFVHVRGERPGDYAPWDALRALRAVLAGDAGQTGGGAFRAVFEALADTHLMGALRPSGVMETLPDAAREGHKLAVAGPRGVVLCAWVVEGTTGGYWRAVEQDRMWTPGTAIECWWVEVPEVDLTRPA